MTSKHDDRVRDWIAFVGDFGGEQYYHSSYSECTAIQARTDLEETLDTEAREFLKGRFAQGERYPTYEVYYFLYPVESETKALDKIESMDDPCQSEWFQYHYDQHKEAPDGRYALSYRYVVDLEGTRFEE